MSIDATWEFGGADSKITLGIEANAHDDYGNEGHVRGEVTRNSEGNYKGSVSAGGSTDTEKEKDKQK